MNWARVEPWLEVGAELCQAGVVEHFLLPQAALAALPTLA